MDWNQWGALIFTGIYTIVASAGFWKFFSQRASEKDAEIALLLGIATEMFYLRAAPSMDRGWIYRDEFDNLVTHIYAPYKVLGGNGTVDRMMEAISVLPLRNVRSLNDLMEERLMGRERRDSDAAARPD